MAGNVSSSPSKKAYYEKYKKEHQREKNKIRDMKKYLKNNPNDVKIVSRVKELQSLVQ